MNDTETKPPDVIVRIDDGERFVRNTNGTYSTACMIPFRDKGHLIMEWPLSALQNKQHFRYE